MVAQHVEVLGPLEGGPHEVLVLDVDKVLGMPDHLDVGLGDALLHQGKFGMGSVLQTQLRSDLPCLICDFSTDRVLLSNLQCDHMFEISGGSQLSQMVRLQRKLA